MRDTIKLGLEYASMEYDDPRWRTLKGGYRVPYDPRPALRNIEANSNTRQAWEELWNELHHQGDVDLASFAAVPHLVRIHAARREPDLDTYTFVAVVEDSRKLKRNPKLPAWLRQEYKAAVRDLSARGLQDLRSAKDPELICSIIALIAFEKGIPSLGQMALMEDDERRDFLNPEQFD